jgi:hypothetical protein
MSGQVRYLIALLNQKAMLLVDKNKLPLFSLSKKKKKTLPLLFFSYFLFFCFNFHNLLHTDRIYDMLPSMDEEFLLLSQHQFPFLILTSSIVLVSGTA